MKLLRYLKCHFIYLLNKRNIISSIIYYLILLTINILVSNIFIDNSILDSNRNTYLNIYKSNYYLIIKMMYIFYIIINNMIFYGNDYNIYSNYFITNSLSYLYYHLSKTIFIFLYYIKEILIYILFFEVVMLITPYGDIYSLDIIFYKNLFLIGIYYSFLSSFFINITHSFISSIIPFIIFFVSNVIDIFESDNIKEIINIFAPNIDINNLLITTPIKYYFLILFISIFINVLTVIKKR